MGDVLSLIEKAQEAIDVDSAKKMAESLKKNEFTLDMFLDQMKQVKKLGSLESILSMIPAWENLPSSWKGWIWTARKSVAGSHHLFHDAPGTAESPYHQRVPAQAHCRRLRSAGAGCEPAAEAVRREQKAHEDHAGHEQVCTEADSNCLSCNKPICKEVNVVAVKIRLKRMGAKKSPFYRIVVADERAPRDGVSSKP